VPLDYDPMLAKLIAWGPDREVARRRMLRALAETRIEGIETSIAFYQTLLREPAYVSNDLSTQFLDRYVYAPKGEEDATLEEFALVAAALQATGKARRARGPGSTSPSAWRTARPTHGLRD
jgi:acetyl/propionyl-CoA carboxylase alpha subunit